MEAAFGLRQILVTDVELVYCSSFLAVCSQWEGLLESVLYEAVCGTDSQMLKNARQVSVKSREHLTNILLFGSKAYVSMSNVKKAEELMALFVKEGRPISLISERNRTLLGQAQIIRNAIAHDSNFAKRKFKESVPGVFSLPSSKRSPGAFLRHEFREQPRQRRYELYFGAYLSAASEMGDAW